MTDTNPYNLTLSNLFYYHTKLITLLQLNQPSQYMGDLYIRSIRDEVEAILSAYQALQATGETHFETEMTETLGFLLVTLISFALIRGIKIQDLINSTVEKLESQVSMLQSL